MPEQLIFDLPVRTALGRGDFFVSQANEAAVLAMEEWENWPSGKHLLIGPPGGGKTHLCHVWANESGAQIIRATELANADIAKLVRSNPNIALEDIDKIAGNDAAQTAAFHLHNLTLAESGRLLITSALEPAQLDLSLADLHSRLSGTAAVSLSLPDDALLSAVMVKLFADRQVDVPANVIQYLAPRIERSFKAAAVAVAALDRLALVENRAISRDLARGVMDKLSASGS